MSDVGEAEVEVNMVDLHEFRGNENRCNSCELQLMLWLRLVLLTVEMIN